MRSFIILNLEELNEVVKWKYLFVNSCSLQLQLSTMDLAEVKEWEILFNKELKSNGASEAVIMASAGALFFCVSLLVANVKMIDLEIKILGIAIIFIGAVLGKLIGLIQARMRLRYMAELLLEEVALRETDETVFDTFVTAVN